MLSRPGNDASNSIQRSKSAASVKERRKHPLAAKSIDPDIAKVHALIAAHRAFDGSREHMSTSSTKSKTSIAQRGQLYSRDRSGHASPASHLQRQRSTLQTRVPKLASTLRVPGAHEARSSRSDSLSYMTEFGSQSENYGAEPSSYRRLRSSRSSLTPLRQTRRPETSTCETPFSQARTLRSTVSSVTLRSPGFRIRLKRSINLLRPDRDRMNRNVTAPAHLQSSGPHHEDVIALARSQFSGELNQPSVSRKPSFSLSGKAKKAQKVFRKSFRVTDGQSDAVSHGQISEDSSTLTLPDKRSLSTTLADKVKKVLRVSRSTAGIPPQQLEATRTHFVPNLQETFTEAGFDSYLDSTQELSSRGIFQAPNPQPRTFDDAKQLTQRLNGSGSRESLASVTKSRTTSWTNSTATDSIATRPSVCDPKRLSIIKEDGGPHQPSSSAGRHIGGVTVFQQPLNIPEGQVINSQRVYSALMRRIDEEQEEMERTQAALREIHDAQDQDEIIGHYLFSAPTIRRVDSRSVTSLADLKEDAQSRGNVASPLEQNVFRCFPLDSDDKAGNRKLFLSPTECQSRLHPASDRRGSGPVSLSRELDKGRNQGDDDADHKSRTSSGAEARSVVVDPSFHNKNPISSRFSHSTDSVYSRTTNGGTNADYMSSLGSTENLGSVSACLVPNGGIATARQVNHRELNLFTLSNHPGRDVAKSNSEVGAWREWMEHQVANPPQREKRQTHIRERTQIDSGDAGVGYDFRSPTKIDMATTENTHQSSKVFPGPQLTVLPPGRLKTASERTDHFIGTRSPQEIPRCSMSTPGTGRSSIQCQSTLQNQTNLYRKPDSANSTPSSEKRKLSSLRKLSPGNVTAMLRTHWNQSNLRSEDQIPGKENRPVKVSTPEPVSTPGRLQAPYAGGAIIEKSWINPGKVSTQRSRNTKADPNLYEHLEESPSNRLADLLSSRLSKPFDMDIPQRNRPFDSTFLGKRETEPNNRLSVASNTAVLRRPKKHGNLGFASSPNSRNSDRESSMMAETTALPLLSSTDGTAQFASERNVSLGKRSMISKFLRTRRLQSSSDTGSSNTEGSAFI